ncbi:glutathione-dependent disulfide-bond oxidoreductase [Thiotrichales bacterium 19S3-7]|nr:glutathione-dependent disulfide-bond oxidoreductase [Thiotrichales bacterium 19S3-7]MCF6802419.1 glutathione-dependent disulfide-bond oxidoreductase [Thiotrichales bacterium 19S3-11]
MEDDDYILPRVWKSEANLGGTWGAINQPTAGARFEKELPTGNKPMQLYSLATPNGIKVGIMLEELLALGYKDAEYDAHIINIGDGDQFSSGFVKINPNSKIPALVDNSVTPGIRVFESGAILFYLAEKFNALIPSELHKRTECLNWLFWQMGSAPYIGGGFGHFYKYAPIKIKYCIDRFTMEAKRQFDVINQQLAKYQFISGDDYTIADIAIFSWYGSLALNRVYEAKEFLNIDEYPNLIRWAELIDQRAPVIQGRKVTSST